MRSLRARILAAFGAAVVAFSGALAYTVVQVQTIGRGLSALDQGYLPLARVAAELDAVARQMDRDHDRFVRSEERPVSGHRSNAVFFSQSLADGAGRGRSQAATARAATDDPEERRALDDIAWLLDAIDEERAGYDAAFEAWWATRSARSVADPAGEARALAELDAGRTALLLRVRHFADRVEGRIQRVSARTAQAQARATAVGTGLSVLAVVFAGGMLAFTLLTLRPVGALTAEVQRLAAGGRPGPVPAGGGDEIALLAREFNQMAAAVAERDERLRERAAALDALSLRLRRVLDTIRAGLVVVEQGVARTVNPAAALLLSIDEGSPLPAPLSELGPGRHGPLAVGAAMVEVDVVPFGATGRLLVAEDVTERLRDRERLARSERLALVGQMLAQITHEVRNPLNAMSLHAELLAEDLADPGARTLLATITSEIRRLESLTARYLELSRGRRPERSPSDPAELVRDVLRVDAAALRRDGAEVLVDAEAVGVVDLDVDALRRAVRNLLLNAVEAGARRVWVRVSRHGEVLRFAVEDDGPGMDEEQRARAFEPFYTTKAAGTGLGLAITRQELEDGGGSVHVEAAPGAGARFVVEVPLGPMEPAPGDR
jgi:signal transduction histidine kinase